MEESGIDPAVCLDFDLAFVLWWSRFTQTSREQVVGKDTSPKLKKGQTMVPKHATLNDIFAAMYRENGTGGFGQDPVAARIDLRQLADAIDREEDAQF